MKKLLFGGKQNFYKGNLHCHSNLSDGRLSPQQLKEFYKANGYSFLAITDHEFLKNNSYLDDEDFITITSTEIAIKEFLGQSTLEKPYMKVCHLNLYAKEQDNDFNFFYNQIYDHFSSLELKKTLKTPPDDFDRVYSGEGVNHIINAANDNGFFVAYNHPRWSLENYSNYSAYEGLWAVEIFNTSCNVSGMYEYDINVADDFLRDGKRIFITSGDDNHNKQQDSFGTFVMINSDELKYERIIDALLKGEFYTSTGPLIYEISIDGLKVSVKCSDAFKICLSTKGRRADSVSAENGQTINKAEFSLFENDGYFRITVIDKFGRRADSQSYFLDDLR